MNSSQNSDDKKAKGDLVPALSDRKVSISVIIPVYNQEAFIKECLDSLLRQTMREWEAVCIDDGSNDSSPAILDSYAESDKRIRVIHQENQGVSFSRNKAIGLASGEYLFFLDPDDLLPEKDVLETLYTRAKEADVNICGGSLEFYDVSETGSESEPGYYFTEDRMTSFEDLQFCYGWTRFIYKRDFLLQNGLSFPEYICYEDPVFFVRAMDKAKIFYAIKKTVYTYRIGHTIHNYSYRHAVDIIRGCNDILTIAKEKGYEKLKTRMIQQLESELDRIIIKYIDEPSSRELRTLIQKTNELCYPENESRIEYKMYAHILRQKEEYLEQILNSRSWKTGQALINPLHKIREIFEKGGR